MMVWQKVAKKPGRSNTNSLGSGPRYQILRVSHVFARCSSQKTDGHARIAFNRVRFSHGRSFFDSRNVQKKTYTSGHCLQS